jgi:hypothetical protein
LTEPEEIAHWAPVPFKLVELDGGRLATGSRARVRRRLVGYSVEFAVDVLEVADERLLSSPTARSRSTSITRYVRSARTAKSK